MREYGQVQSAFWQSEDAGKLSDRGKLLAVYLLTSPHTNGVGCFRLTDGYLWDDLKWSSETVTETLSELFHIGFAIRVGGIIFVPKFLHWNKIANGNIAIARFGDWEAISKGRLKSFAARAMLEFSDRWIASHRAVLETVSQTVTETLSELFRNGMANHDLQVENQHPTPPHPTPPQNIPLVQIDKTDELALMPTTTAATKPKRAKTPATPGRFDEFWAIYPRHVARKDAEKAFYKAATTTELVETILAAIDKQAKSLKWQNEPKFIPHAATWLNGERWKDQVDGIAASIAAAPADPPRKYFTAPKLDGSDPGAIAGKPIDKTKTAEIIRDLGRKLRIPT